MSHSTSGSSGVSNGAGSVLGATTPSIVAPALPTVLGASTPIVGGAAILPVTGNDTVISLLLIVSMLIGALVLLSFVTSRIARRFI